ncbi:hypothetical protein CRYUN_Cryun19dG0117800 [Craigia yunnanensis]
MEGKMLEMIEVGPCEDDYQLGFLAGDLILQNHLLPFARTPQTQPLIKALSETNQKKFPRYWAELLGTAEGSGMPVLDIILINFRKEILPFISNTAMNSNADAADDSSDILIVSELITRTQMSFLWATRMVYFPVRCSDSRTAFTLNSVPPTEGEIVPAGIGRNFVSRDLEATSIADALAVRPSNVRFFYNLIDIKMHLILNVETASRSRVSVHEVGATPFFHPNMYLHLQAQQVNNRSQKRRNLHQGKSTTP